MPDLLLDPTLADITWEELLHRVHSQLPYIMVIGLIAFSAGLLALRVYGEKPCAAVYGSGVGLMATMIAIAIYTERVHGGALVLDGATVWMLFVWLSASVFSGVSGGYGGGRIPWFRRDPPASEKQML